MRNASTVRAAFSLLLCRRCRCSGQFCGRSGPHIILAIGATTLTLLYLPLAAYVAMKQIASLAITAAGIALTIHLALRTARREGFIAERPMRRRQPSDSTALPASVHA